MVMVLQKSSLGSISMPKSLARYIQALLAFVVTLCCDNSVPSTCSKKYVCYLWAIRARPSSLQSNFMSVFEVTHVLDLYTLSLSLFLLDGGSHCMHATLFISLFHSSTLQPKLTRGIQRVRKLCCFKYSKLYYAHITNISPLCSYFRKLTRK